MVPLIKATMPKERNTAKANLPGPIIVHILETSMITIYTEQVSMNGLMVVSIQVNGGITRWKAMELSLGLMAGNMWVSISTI
jgi:hypothetical protein